MAVKCIPRSTLTPWNEIDILNEVSSISTLENPNIVPLVDFFVQPDCYSIVMEFCEGGIGLIGLDNVSIAGKGKAMLVR